MDLRTGIMDFNGSGKDLSELYELRTSGPSVTTHYVSQTYGKDLGSIFIMNANLGGLGLVGNVGANCGHKLLNGIDLGSMFCSKGTVVSIVNYFTPLMVSGCSLWLDAADMTTLFTNAAGTGAVTGTTTGVKYWKNKAGSSNNATWSNNSATPALNNTAGVSYTAGAYPSLTFGANVASDINMSFTGISDIFVVSSHTAATYAQYYGMIGSEGPVYFCGNQNATTISGQLKPPTVMYNGGTTPPASAANLNMFAMVGGSGSTLLNPGLVGIGRGDATNNRWLGTIREVLIYTSTLSTLNRQNIESYLAKKWGIQSLLPKDHPSLIVFNGNFSQTITGTSFISQTANDINNWTHNADISTNYFGILTTADATYVEGTSTTSPYVSLPAGMSQYLMSRIQTTNVAVSHFIKQTVTIASAGIYTLTFYHAGRTGTSLYSANHTLKVDLGTSTIVTGLATTTSATVSAVGWQLFTGNVYFSYDDIGTKDLTLTFTNSSTGTTDSAYFVTGVALNYVGNNNIITFTSSSILALSNVSIQVLAVGGGGSGGGGYGGGGAGGFLETTRTITGATTITVAIGAGGVSTVNSGLGGTTRGNFTGGYASIIAGGGGGSSTIVPASGNNGSADGGSGGGSSRVNSSNVGGGIANTSNGNFANNGGNSSTVTSWGAAGGGGGAGSAGAQGYSDSSPQNDKGGNGGIGKQSSITGTAVYYAGGGGGGSYAGTDLTTGLGGSGGGGVGNRGGRAATNGTPNTGGGGGGTNTPTIGGSGIFIVKIL